jgi:hypothetical protein
MVMGINVGPMLLAIENYRSRQIWELTAQSPEIASGLDRIFGVGSPRGTGVSMIPGGDRHSVNIRWEPEPGVSCYSVYSSTDLENWSLRQVDIRGTAWTDRDFGKSPQRFYLVKSVR